MKNRLMILLLIFCLTGCYNYRELNDLAITTAVGIDKVEDNYKITAQIINTQKNVIGEGSTNPKTFVYSGTGKTMQEALRKIILTSPKRLYTYHVQVVVVSEEVARGGMKKFLDLVFRDSEARSRFLALVARDVSSEDILKSLTQLDTIGSSSIEKSILANNQYRGITSITTFEDLIDNYLNPNTEISIPSITIIGDVNEADKLENVDQSKANSLLKVSDMAIFKDDKLLGFLNAKESLALNFIKNEIKNALVTYECDKNKYVTVELMNAKSDVSIVKNNLKINISISGGGNISEVHCKMDLEDPKVIDQIENNVNKKIEKTILDSHRFIVDNYNTDVFGFREMFYQNNYSYFKKINKDWYSKNFSKIKLNVKSDISILEKGNTLRTIDYGK